jgi:Flp pilus assembly protein TadD
MHFALGEAFMSSVKRRNLAKSRNPKNLAAQAERHHLNGRLDRAERKYREAIALNPAYVEAHNNLGMILQERGRVAEATAQFVKTFEICPTDARIVFNLARALSAQHQCREAVVLYRQAVALRPHFADAHFGLGLNLAQLGEYSEAEHSYRKTLQLDPHHWQARINLGLALVEQGKVVQGLEQAEMLAREENEAGFPHKSFGILLARAGCVEGARACFETHLLQNPDDEDEIAVLFATIGSARRA